MLMWLKKLFNRFAISATDRERQMKEIVYRGGLVTFAIPANWIEEYGDDGGGIFFEDYRDSGTLRLNVLTFESNEQSDNIDVDTLVKEKAKERGGIAIILDEGNALVRYDEQSIENGEQITLRYWSVYNPVPPNHVRVAVFSYTLLSSQFTKSRYVKELEMLDREIAKIRFATSLGK
jgi:hypothetical protein